MTHAMRWNAIFTAAFAALVLSGCGTEETTARREQPQQQRVFAMLDEYGNWIDIQEYGAVWRPRVSVDWRPYAYGHWEWSDQGWVWIGYEPFAWVVYHYGSWFDDREYGWVWVPSYDWAPARVAWITADEYTCWAPLPPAGRVVPQPGDPYWDRTWVVVPSTQFTSENVVRYNVRQDSRSIGRVRVGAQRPPDIREVAKTADVSSQPMRVETDKIQSGGRELNRMRVPAQDERKIRSHDAEVQPLIRRRAADQGVEPGRDRQPVMNQETPPPVVTPAKPPTENQLPAAVPDRTQPKTDNVVQPTPAPVVTPDRKTTRSKGVKPVSKPPAKTRKQTPAAEKQAKPKKEEKQNPSK